MVTALLALEPITTKTGDCPESAALSGTRTLGADVVGEV